MHNEDVDGNSWNLRISGLGFARQGLIAHGRQIGQRGDHHSRLPQILGLQVVESIEVGVMDMGEVIEIVLHELEPRNAHAVEGNMIGAAGVAVGDGGHANIRILVCIILYIYSL